MFIYVFVTERVLKRKKIIINLPHFITTVRNAFVKPVMKNYALSKHPANSVTGQLKYRECLLNARLCHA